MFVCCPLWFLHVHYAVQYPGITLHLLILVFIFCCCCYYSGEKLSKQQLQSNNIVKKLRSKEKESDALIKKQRYGTVLCIAVLTTVLCCPVLCCAVLCCAVLCCAVLCCAVLCCAVLCCAVLCCAVLHCGILYIPVQYVVLCSSRNYPLVPGMTWYALCQIMQFNIKFISSVKKLITNCYYNIRTNNLYEFRQKQTKDCPPHLRTEAGANLVGKWLYLQVLNSRKGFIDPASLREPQ